MLSLKITTVIIEKNSESLDKIYSELKKIEELSIVGVTTDINKGISLITNYSPNLIFVSTELHETGGIEFVNMLHNRNTYPEVIFLANDISNAYEALKVKPFDYLLKPITKETVKQVLIRLKTKFKKMELMRKMDIFAKLNSVGVKRIFKQKGGIIIIPLEEIVYCKAERTKTILMLRSGNPIQLNTSIGETLETINSEEFSRIGRSHFINRNYLRKIDKRQCKCHLHHHDQNWIVPASKNTIVQLEKLNLSPIY
ncbi:response regulator [Draconibacterium sp.]|nr:response regulator [Draconibacterium sp.]